MAVILSIETSTDVCSVALHNGNTLLSEAVLREPQAHASRLAPLIEQVTRASKVDFKDLSAIAVSKGPGSYTGLRIGTSTAKGLCYALDIPLIAVGTLELLAYQGQPYCETNALLCPMIDARRMEVYTLTADASLNIVEAVSARIIDESSYLELLNTRRMFFFGNGAAKCRSVITHQNAVFIEGIDPMAKSLGEMAEGLFSASKFEDLVQFKPFYLKEFVAKRAGAGI
jgi:tRNA threonylcarbamoyladenosine biosynthesis protein TsaB